MAQKKSAVKKPTASKAKGKAKASAAPKPKAEKAAPPKVDLHALRVKADEADARVQDAVRGVNKAKSDQSDYVARDGRVTKAQENLKLARWEAAEARAHFEDEKRKA